MRGQLLVPFHSIKGGSVGVQPLPIGTLNFEIARRHERSLLWKTTNVCERIAAAVTLLALLPALIAIALVTMILSRRSPLIAHKRVGYGGREIWVLKLRTMWQKHAPWNLSPFIERFASESVPDLKTRNDPRVTSRFAKLCRKHSVDELPQLWHVVRGEMALIGPRPLTASELELYYGRHTQKLLSVKPGLTGIWQVKGRSRLTYPQRRRLDLFMLKKWSLSLYVRILLESVPAVLIGKDAW